LLKKDFLFFIFISGENPYNCKKEKTRIHHQHLCLGEELPGLHCKDMKSSGFNKAFFEVVVFQ